MKDILSKESQKIIAKARQIADQHKNTLLEPAHVLAALLDDKSIQSALQQAGMNKEVAVNDVNRAIQQLLKGSDNWSQSSAEIPLSREFSRLMSVAEQFVQQQNAQHIQPIDLITVLILGRFDLVKLLEKAGLNVDTFTEELADGDQKDEIKKYTTDVTQQARDGKIDPVIGRDSEIRRLIQVLLRRTKNNPVLVGLPGVGKTAIVEGLAQRIVNEEVPDAMLNRKLLALDLGALIAGTKYRGEFEDRLKKILKYVQRHTDEGILFIDELHMMGGAGGTGDSAMDAGNLLKPALARGSLHCIGATTFDEYREYIEKDAALERRFQMVKVPEPNEDDTIAILRGLKEKYEIHHGVRITDDAIVAAARLGRRFITGRQSPDIEIDVLDEAASQIRMEMDSKPEQLDSIERRLIQYRIEEKALKKDSGKAKSDRLNVIEKKIQDDENEYKSLEKIWLAEKELLSESLHIKESLEHAKHALEIASRAGDLTKMSEVQYGQIPQLESELQSKEEQLHEKLVLTKNKVTETEVAHIVSRWTGIPVQKMIGSDKKRLLNLADILHKYVIGQNDAVDAVVSAIQRSRIGIGDRNRPVGSFLFLGPTGVGKTELCKALANELFDDSHAFIRLDMSEYMEKHAISRLIGSPPGYVGHEEGGYLTEQVRRKPYSVVLLDEVEKAHPDIFNTLLQVLDDGRLTDSMGRTIDFRHTIVVMTSNLGSEFLLQAHKDNDIEQEVMVAVKAFFKPEFLNRIDDIVMFHALDKSNLTHIVKLQLELLEQKLFEQGIKLRVTDDVKKWICNIGYDPQYGARPLRRAIQNNLANSIARFLLGCEDAESRTLVAEMDNDSVVITEVVE